MATAVGNHPDVVKGFADEFERTRKVGRIYLASDEKVVDVLATQSHWPVWSCCSWLFWCNLIDVCCRTCCFICTCFLNPKGTCKWNIHRERYNTVLVLTNRRIIRYKDSDGSASKRAPQRYSHQQIHLSAIGYSESHYAQALPGMCARLMMCIGCCTSCCHGERVASLKFQTKYPKPGITEESPFHQLLSHSKLDTNPFSFMWRCIKFAFRALFVQPGISLFEALGLIKPSTETIIYDELLSKYRDRVENLGHEHNVTDIQRFDKFYQNFNLMRSQYSDQHKIPPLNSDSFEVVNGQSWEDAYDRDVADDGGIGDKVFVNSHATGFISSGSSEHSEQVIEAINVTHQASCLDWIKCCFTCGCYFCGFISPLRSFKQFFIFTTHRAMKTVIFSGKNASGKYGTMNAYTRTVSSWYDCIPTKGARFEQNEALCACCMCCACCNKPLNASMDIMTDFGSFKLDVISRKKIYPKLQAVFSHLVQHFQTKNSFTADKLAPHVAQHHRVSDRAAVFAVECNKGSITGKSLEEIMTPLTKPNENIHAGVYQYGDWTLSGEAGGADTFFKKYICPDKFWWHSALVVTDNKVITFFNRNSSAERNANICITMTPADKIKASAFYHTAQSSSFKCFECCIQVKNLSGESVNPADNLDSYVFGIKRAEIHLGTGSGTSMHFGKSSGAAAGAAKNTMAAKPLPFFGSELSNHSAAKAEVPQQLTEQEVELERLYAVLSAVSYLANEKGIKHEVAVKELSPTYNSTPMAAGGN